MELFDFCRCGFDVLSVGFCFAATERKHCLSFSKPHHFTIVDINGVENLQDEVEPNILQNHFCTVVKAIDEFGLFSVSYFYFYHWWNAGQFTI
jgi:hypothetical protein